MRNSAPTRDIEPIHPGEILREEFLVEYGLSQYELAKNVGVPLPRINAIVLGKRGISADTALRLARFFGNTPEFWLNLQNHYDLEVAFNKSGEEIRQAVTSDIGQLVERGKARRVER